jgi:cell division control protein 45
MDDLFTLSIVQLRTVITINCGGVVDIGELLRLPKQVKIYVLDSHRPYHLANVYDEDQVFLVDDGEVRSSIPELSSDMEDSEAESDSVSEDVSDTDASASDRYIPSVRKRRVPLLTFALLVV